MSSQDVEAWERFLASILKSAGVWGVTRSDILNKVVNEMGEP